MESPGTNPVAALRSPSLMFGDLVDRACALPHQHPGTGRCRLLAGRVARARSTGAPSRAPVFGAASTRSSPRLPPAQAMSGPSARQWRRGRIAAPGAAISAQCWTQAGRQGPV